MNNETSQTPAPNTIKVNVGTPGNVRTLSLDAGKTWTAAEVLAVAEIPVTGYDMRINGKPSTGTATVVDGQTILLLAPVRGNLRFNIPDDFGQPKTIVAPVASSEAAAAAVPAPAPAPATLKVNVGTPGNVRPLALEAGKTWTVAEVLARAEISAQGYDVRVNGQPSTLQSPVGDNQTVLLLAPVRGNELNG